MSLLTLLLLFGPAALADDPDAFSVPGTSVVEEPLDDAPPEPPGPEPTLLVIEPEQETDPIGASAAAAPVDKPMSDVDGTAVDLAADVDAAPVPAVAPDTDEDAGFIIIAPPTARDHLREARITATANAREDAATLRDRAREDAAVLKERARDDAARVRERAEERRAERQTEPLPPPVAPAPPIAPMPSSGRIDADQPRQKVFGKHKRGEPHRQVYVGSNHVGTTLAGAPALLRGLELGTVGRQGLVLGFEAATGGARLADGRELDLKMAGLRIGVAFRAEKTFGLRLDALIGGALLEDAVHDRNIGSLTVLSPRVALEWRVRPWFKVSPAVGLRQVHGLGAEDALSGATASIAFRVGRF